VKSFDLMAVHEVDFSLPKKNEIRAIIGPNGAGKTTFFNLLTGHLFLPGKIVFRRGYHRPFSRQDLSQSVRSLVTNIFTTFPLWIFGSPSVRTGSIPFMHVSRLRKEREKAEKILELVGLKDMAKSLAPNLSHGDQRHLEIGIALATNPILLLLDEPTAGMSPAETTTTAKLIKRIAREEGLTIIIVEHDMAVVMEVADTISVFHQGSIIAEGSPDAIRKDEKVQEAYLKETPTC
jgi:branched-chain amino acid transport system ATP-binding protein